MSRSNKYRAVIFDMDGTILDTIEDLTDSLNYVMEKYGYPLHTVEEMKTFVGNGMYKMVERAVAGAVPGRPDVSVPGGVQAVQAAKGPESKDRSMDVSIREMYECFRSYYKDHCKIKTGPYPGITELLKKLRESGVKTAVISNKADEAVKELCDSVFADCFDFYMGAMDGIRLKPDRDMVDIALKRLGVSGDEAVYVGDSQVDLQTARNAEMDCISVTWGFRNREFLIENGALILVDEPSEIFKLVG